MTENLSCVTLGAWEAVELRMSGFGVGSCSSSAGIRMTAKAHENHQDLGLADMLCSADPWGPTCFSWDRLSPGIFDLISDARKFHQQVHHLPRWALLALKATKDTLQWVVHPSSSQGLTQTHSAEPPHNGWDSSATTIAFPRQGDSLQLAALL